MTHGMSEDAWEHLTQALAIVAAPTSTFPPTSHRLPTLLAQWEVPLVRWPT